VPEAGLPVAGPEKPPVEPPPEFFKALEEFNQRRFFECHETLEDLWNAERGELRRFYQGLLQVGVGYYKITTRPNYRGALSLLESGAGYLRRFAPSQFGIDVTGLLEIVEASRRELERLGEHGMDQFDRQLIPTLKAENTHDPT
jgi:predicted metal-dependent hydrolase